MAANVLFTQRESTSDPGKIFMNLLYATPLFSQNSSWSYTVTVFKDIFFTALVTDEQYSYIIKRKYTLEDAGNHLCGLVNSAGERVKTFLTNDAKRSLIW